MSSDQVNVTTPSPACCGGNGAAAPDARQVRESLQGVFSCFQGRRDELIPILQKVQEQFGYLPEAAMLEIARFTRVPEAQVYAVATFYAQFRFTPIGRTHVMVCRGTSCHVRGAPRILEEVEKQLGIKEGETSADLEYSLETVACIGACGLSPCIMANKKVEAKLTPKKVAELFKKAGGDDGQS
ncbi:MAG: NADH-quinone oxidoreductase subunit NuoE [Pirellulales bacterium]|nr:NADH-quinone oxidoreductase subunit NuoE [Pirellulales bacterium]